MGKVIGSTEDVWKPAVDIDVPELDVTLSPLLTPGSAPAAEKPDLTAEPEVTTVHVKPGDFVVLGTKGLFECLSDQEIVGLVGVWVEERRRHPELRQSTKSAIGTQSEKHKDRPASNLGIVVAIGNVAQEIKQAHQKNAIPQMDRVRVEVQLREAVLSIGPRNLTDHFSDAFEDRVSERLDTPIRRMVYRDQLPVIRSRSGGDILSQSIGEDDSSDLDRELLDLGFKNSNMNAARKVSPRFPYSWRNQEPHFVMVEGDLCSVSAASHGECVQHERP